jgi:hypothetical protein
VKTMGLIGLLSLLWIGASNKVEGGPSEVAQNPDRSITVPGPVAMESSGNLPGSVSEYVFLHQTRFESIRVHAMAGVKACPE